MTQAKAPKSRPILLMPRLEREEITALRKLARARLKRMIEHIKAGRFEAARRDGQAIETMATLHSEEMFQSV